MSMRELKLPNGVVLSAEDQHKLSWTGDYSGAWLQALPELIREWCERWNVTLEPDIPEIHYNLVLFGTSKEHGSVAIKTSPPHEEVAAEIAALRAVQKPGIVRLFDSTSEVSIMLQQRVVPGTSLNAMMERGDISDERATAIAADAMRRFASPVPIGARLIPLRSWFSALYAYRDAHPEGNGAIAGDLIDVAISFAEQLLSTATEAVTLHGDLNPGNILWDDKDGWVIIDPKGLIGPRGYEVGTWMINPYGLHTWPNLEETLSRRLDQLADLLDLDRYRLWQWSIVHAVLSECWTLEGNGNEPDHLHALDIARTLLSMPGSTS